jgi:hypothetical protein
MPSAPETAHFTHLIAGGRMSETLQFSFSLEQQEDFAFLIRFDNGLPPLLAGEPALPGKGWEGPILRAGPALERS